MCYLEGMNRTDIHDDLWQALKDVGETIEGDGNILFTNIGELSEVVAMFARKSVIDQQKRCELVCLSLAQANEARDAGLATALRKCADEIRQLGH